LVLRAGCLVRCQVPCAWCGAQCRDQPCCLSGARGTWHEAPHMARGT